MSHGRNATLALNSVYVAEDYWKYELINKTGGLFNVTCMK